MSVRTAEGANEMELRMKLPRLLRASNSHPTHPRLRSWETYWKSAGIVMVHCRNSAYKTNLSDLHLMLTKSMDKKAFVFFRVNGAANEDGPLLSLLDLQA